MLKKKKVTQLENSDAIASSDLSDLSPILSISMEDCFHGHTLFLLLFSFYLSSSLFASSSCTQSCKYRYSLRWLWPPHPSTCIKGFVTSQKPIIGKSCQHFLQNRESNPLSFFHTNYYKLFSPWTSLWFIPNKVVESDLFDNSCQEHVTPLFKNPPLVSYLSKGKGQSPNDHL